MISGRNHWCDYLDANECCQNGAGRRAALVCGRGNLSTVGESQPESESFAGAQQMLFSALCCPRANKHFSEGPGSEPATPKQNPNMSDDEEVTAKKETPEEAALSKKNKYRKPKPWDVEGTDHWKLEPFNGKEDNPTGTSFFKSNTVGRGASLWSQQV